MELKQIDQTIYPTLNIHFSPRVYQQRVDFKSKPLSKYIGPVNGQSTQLFQNPQPNQNLVKAFNKNDGMIFNFKQMQTDSQIRSSIKIMICVCMYNESAGAIQLTLQGIYNNLIGLEREGISHEEVAVVLIQDGILKLVADRNKRTYAQGKQSMVNFYRELDKSAGKNKCDLQQRLHTILDSIQQYNRKGQPQGYRNNQDFPKNIEKNISLLYQNEWKPLKTKGIYSEEELKKNQKKDIQWDNGMFLKVFSCFKHTNGTKLSSHLLFFQGFCRYLDPQFVVLLDVGTKPDDQGIVNLIRGFYLGDNIGGVTGLMSIDSNFKSLQGNSADSSQNQKNWLEQFAVSIQKAQQYQYVIAHFLDKNAQSALGFLHVLPGAWSAYRYKALIKSDKYEPNLLQKRYFKMILNPEIQENDYRQANMYLAEDRILSLGIYCQMDSDYILKYVPDAIAYTDPMKDHKNLMNQRRRWINSSLFAFQYVLENYYHHVTESKHSWFNRYVTLNISMMLALLSFINSYFTPAIYFFVLYITIAQIQNSSGLAAIVSTIYCLLVLTAVGGSLAGKRWVQRAHTLSYMLSFFTFIMFGLVTYNLLVIYINLMNIDMSKFNTASVVIMAFINIGCFFLLIMMHMLASVHWKFVWRLIVDTVSYMTFQGAYSQTMVIYAFCNVDDVSWGTKGAGASGKKKYQAQKVFFVSKWLFFNSLLAYIFIYIDLVIPQRTGGQGGKVLLAIAIYATSVILIKTILAMMHYLKWLFCDYYCTRKYNIDSGRKGKVQAFWNKKKQEYKQKYQKLISVAVPHKPIIYRKIK